METVVQKTIPNVTAQSICHKAKICRFFITRICKCKRSEYLWLDLQAMGVGGGGAVGERYNNDKSGHRHIKDLRL